MTKIAHLVVPAILAAGAGRAQADTPELTAGAPAFQPSLYVVAMTGTTLAYHAPDSDGFAGLQHDVTPMAGFGVVAQEHLAVELDAGPTLVNGDYAAFSLVPSLISPLGAHAYVVAGVSFLVDPEPNVGLLSGLGVTHAFDSGVAPFLTATAITNVGQGHPDLALALTAGATFTP
jgi:hypothetical protein